MPPKAGKSKANGSSSASDTRGDSKKRKAESSQEEPSKSSRRSARHTPKSKPSHPRLLNFLLSTTATDYCRPDDEVKDIPDDKGAAAKYKTYSSSILSPFEELLCAVVLSRPISHRLGQRTIRTILNPPYSYTAPRAILAAKPEDRHQAMFDARTQHKDKTATQIGQVARVVADDFAADEGDASLDGLRGKAGRDWPAERDLLRSGIKGLGPTGLDIFRRRVQWLWPEAWPFVDARTARALDKLGLPGDAEALIELIDQHWGAIDKAPLKEVQGGEPLKKKRAFVVICERATGADLEGKVEGVLEQAAAAE